MSPPKAYIPSSAWHTGETTFPFNAWILRRGKAKGMRGAQVRTQHLRNHPPATRLPVGLPEEGHSLQPRRPIAHGSRAVSPEVQHITDMTQMYSLFITSYSLHCNLRGQEGREGAVGQVRQERGGCVNIKPVLQTHRCLSSRQKEKEGKTPRC